MHIHSFTRAALAASVLAVTAAGPVAAATVPADLRVEATGNNDLSHGWTYFSDTTTLTSDTGEACGGKGQPHTLTGANALGILDAARGHNDRLEPIRFSDEFDFGLLVCGISSFLASDAEAQYWTYKVNHVSPEVSADQYPLQPGDEVLWTFSNYTTGELSGNELELEAPESAGSGEPFEVTVSEYDFAGKKTPAAGAEVHGGGQVVTTGADGKATVTIGGKTGSAVIRAYRGIDVPSRGVRVCVGTCQKIVKERLFGTGARDLIEAKNRAHAEFVDAGGGNDKIDVSGDTFSDKVRCGGGRDTVTADRRDRIASDCEKVTRK